MTDATAIFHDLMGAHRSIRRYKSDPLDPALIDAVLVQALHGSSSSGNLNTATVIKTMDAERRRSLWALHARQDMILQAPCVLTFCADTHRTRTWLAQRGARLGFGDLKSFLMAAFDAVILAQTAALAFESRGLGICYMGTTLFSMERIAEFLDLPDHCVPVTSLVVGWPDEAPSQRDRLPGALWIHDERYRHPTPEHIDAHYAGRDRRGWERYRNADPSLIEQMREAGITSLAQYYTSPLKYDPDLFARFSREIHAAIEARGFGVPPAPTQTD